MNYLDEIKTILQREFPDAEIDVSDMTGTMDHLSVNIKSEKFKGISLLEQHQMVMNGLKEEFSGYLHALKLKTGVK